MNQNNQIALGATFLISVFLLILLILAKMSWNPLTDTPEPDPYIVMNQLPETEEEYMEVEVEELPLLNSDSESPAFTPEEMDNESQLGAPSGNYIKSQGAVGEPTPPVTQSTPSPVVSNTPQTTKPGANVENKEEIERAEAQKKAEGDIASAFNKKGNTNKGTQDDGLNGVPNNNDKTTTGSRTGTGTAKVGGGWKAPAYPKNISSQTTGSVEFLVTVKADGSVENVEIYKDDPNLTSATKNACMAVIKRERFKAPPNNTEGTTAYVTFTFQDPK